MKLDKEQNNLCKFIRKGNIRFRVELLCPVRFTDTLLLVWADFTRKVSKP